MIKKWYNIWKEKRATKARAVAAYQLKIETERIKMYTQLYTQSVVNVRYIEASISTMSGMCNGIKGDNATETRKRRTAVRAQIEWYHRKLHEERGMAEHFGKLAGINNDEIKFNLK